MADGNGDIYITWARLFGIVIAVIVPVIMVNVTVWLNLASDINDLAGAMDRKIVAVQAATTKVIEREMELHSASLHAGAMPRTEIDRMERQLNNRIDKLEGR